MTASDALVGSIVGGFLFIMGMGILSACAPSNDPEVQAEREAWQRERNTPSYFRDELANRCYVDFPARAYSYPAETECTPEVLRAIDIQSQLKEAGL